MTSNNTAYQKLFLGNNAGISTATSDSKELQGLKYMKISSSNQHGNQYNPASESATAYDGNDNSYQFSPAKVAGYSKAEDIISSLDDFSVTREPRWAFEGEKLKQFSEETTALKVLVVTWNMFGTKQENSVEKLLGLKKTEHHIISISSQECLRSISESFWNDSKEEWLAVLKLNLEDQYTLVKDHTMGAAHLAVFARKELYPHVKKISSAHVATGWGNILKNKGGIGISFEIKGNSFLFINTHLPSGQEFAQKRNDSFLKIISTMGLPCSVFRKGNENPQQRNILKECDFVFWAGDMNYRVDMDYDDTIKCFDEKRFYDLLAKDQLLAERNKEGSVFKSLTEGKIRFAPTYKFQLYGEEYEGAKKRGYAWTDRILHGCNSLTGKLEQVSYDANRKVYGSDHRPVFSQFIATIEPKKPGVELEGFELNQGCCFW